MSTHRRSSINPLPLDPPSIQKTSSSLLKRLSRSSPDKSSPSSSSSKSLGSKFRLLSATVGTPLGRRNSRSSVSSSNNANANTMQETDAAADDAAALFRFLETECPQDVLPKILACAGPRKAAALSQTNRFWKNVTSKEGTWRVMCEELYKWKLGDPEPASWLEHYCRNPCVPVDYRSVHTAMESALGRDDDYTSTSTLNRRSPETTIQHRSVRILLRPGKHYLREAISIQTAGQTKVTIETLDLPKNVFRSPRVVQAVEQATEAPVPPKRAKSLRGLFCRARSSSERVEETEHSEGSFDAQDWMDLIPRHRAKDATLVLRSRRHNEPAFRVKQGTLILNNVEIQHNSHGIDIWNGNAAIQVQPPETEDGAPLRRGPRPCAILQGVKVTSRSGRGIVNIDGGKIVLRGCAFHDCAATGIYVGGQGSQAEVEHTDVVRNGVGSRSSRRGIARGHSGVYLEQGSASIRECNISFNTLTGISSVSADSSFLTLEDSDLALNGTFQLEMPASGTAARRRSIVRNNNMSAVSVGRLRSGLLPETDNNNDSDNSNSSSSNLSSSNNNSSSHESQMG